jgi:diguanylate cyclase
MRELGFVPRANKPPLAPARGPAKLPGVGELPTIVGPARLDAGAPLFILSFRQRDELQALAQRGGWHAIAARRTEGLEARFLGTGAGVAVVDARGALAEGLEAAASLGSAIATNGAAMLVLVSRGDVGALADFHDAGATHFLVSPHSEAEFLQALRYALRHAERLTGRTAVLLPSLATVETHDPLTGGNDAAHARRWLERRLERPGSGPLHAMLVGLSRFDMVNTAYGRQAGDAVLKAAYRRIVEVIDGTLGRGAVVARMDGAEFLIASDAAAARVELAAAAINSALSRPFVTGDTITVVGCRIGVAARAPGDQPTVLLRRASEALASAKASDSSTMRTAVSFDGAPVGDLAIDLRRALERDELDVLYQPQVSVATRAVIGAEALARWEHPRLGALGAEALFAAAERADLAMAVSDRVQALALERAAGWPESLRGLRLSINLTAADIARPDFADHLLDRVDTSGFPRDRLTVEITESGLIEDLGRAAALFATLRAAGLRIAIDDFGTGYSSLAYLKSLPLDYLKIDKRLADDIAGSPRDRVVVRGVIEMARSLGLAVVAEGVETEAQLDLLAQEGCQYFQGFLCAEPLTGDALAALLAD